MWQPIDTAPGHTEVLAYRPDAGVMIAIYTSLDTLIPESEYDKYSDDDLLEYDWFYHGFEGGRLDEPPTHWMPLPEAPEVGT